jgi:hypothetical protein
VDLAHSVASTTSRELAKYGGVFLEISLLRPEFADAYINQLLGADEPQLEQWTAGVRLSKQLIRNDRLHTDLDQAAEIRWVDVRRSIARGFGRQLEMATRERERIDRVFPRDELTHVRQLLLILARDPDVGPTADESTEGLARGDHITGSLHYVRPLALEALIDCELCRAFRSPDFSDEFGPSRLDRVVRGLLAEQLSVDSDGIGTIHSVLGRRLTDVVWLDEVWTLCNLDAIFPAGDSSQERLKFTAAFDSFTWAKRHRIYRSLFDALRPKYARAIADLHRNAISDKQNFAAEGLSAQLLWDFLYGQYDLVSVKGEESLLAEFVRKTSAHSQSHTAWLLWDIWRQCQTQCEPQLLTQFWRRTRLLWEWRVAEASRLNHPADFDGEMEWYCHLAGLAPATETLASFWPLLEGLLPHLSGPSSRHFGWDELERYLSSQVDRDRVRTIRMYRLMHEQRRNTRFRTFRFENERKILEVALAFEDSRGDALAVINLIASKEGSDRHRELYEQYAGR